MLYWDAYYGEIAMAYEASHGRPPLVQDELDVVWRRFILLWSTAVLALTTSVAALIHWLS